MAPQGSAGARPRELGGPPTLCDARGARERRYGMPRPFRFGVQLATLPHDGWRERARLIESLGYSSVFFPDHFGPQWEPVAALAAVA